MKKYIASFVFILICFVAATGTVAYANQPLNDTFDSPVTLSGHAWSPNIGWILFDDPNARVTLHPNGRLNGYAWSPHVGWIHFGIGSGCPGGGSCLSRVDLNTNQLSGWARALNAGNGWDGWISLNASNHSASTYGVSVQGSGAFAGYAWGSDVVGWLNFSGVSINTPCAATRACTADATGVESTNMWCESTTSVCAVGNSCVPATASCIAGTNTLTVEPDLVRTGDRVTVAWDTVPGMFSSCRVVGSSDVWNGLSNTSGATSNPLGRNTAVYQLICVDASTGTESVIKQVRVRVLPSIKEI